MATSAAGMLSKKRCSAPPILLEWEVIGWSCKPKKLAVAFSCWLNVCGLMWTTVESGFFSLRIFEMIFVSTASVTKAYPSGPVLD